MLFESFVFLCFVVVLYFALTSMTVYVVVIVLFEFSL